MDDIQDVIARTISVKLGPLAPGRGRPTAPTPPWLRACQHAIRPEQSCGTRTAHVSIIINETIIINAYSAYKKFIAMKNARS